jgi:hypothetical protein
MNVKVGQVWRCNGGVELRVTDINAVGGVEFALRDGSTAAVWAMRYMTPANGWELVEDVCSHKWSSDGYCCYLCGFTGRPTEAAGSEHDGPARFNSGLGGFSDTPKAPQVLRITADPSIPAGYVQVGDELHPAPWATLVQDVGEASCDWQRTCGDEDCPRCDAWAPAAKAEACAEVPWKAAFRDAMKPWKRPDTETPWFAEYVYPYPPPKQLQCLANLAALPVSAEFVQGTFVLPPGEPAPWVVGAERDLRRQASTLRSWPLCPNTQEPYRIEASVLEEHNMRKPGSAGRESVRFWRAAFTCKCGGGK